MQQCNPSTTTPTRELSMVEGQTWWRVVLELGFQRYHRRHRRLLHSPWESWLGAKAMAEAIREKRDRIWKVFMVMLFVIN